MLSRTLGSIGVFLEPLSRVLPDGLQHPVALVRVTDEALLNERLESVEVGVCDLFGGLERAAAGEDREAGEELPPSLREEAVGPLDRGA
jgi:hypothetical protein